MILLGCTSPTLRADRLASAQGFESLRLPGAPFEHAAYFKPSPGMTVLHVYIEHDGTPWQDPTTPAADPTPRQPLMLALMAQDDAPSLYLGRPCHFGTAATVPCEPVWWTHRRFSAEVVGSMQAALARFLRSHPHFERLHFFGYSGGGVIATLLAPKFAEAQRLITLAAPLDVDGWARRHRFSPLRGSLSPIDLPPLPESIDQLHVAGAADEVVPADLIRPFVARQPRAEYREFAGFDHRCCWDAVWRDLLRPPQNAVAPATR